MTTLTADQRIYYTGDMANQSGWFTASVGTDGTVTLFEIDGEREFTMPARLIGHVYQGHCDPRFVTAEAVATYRAQRGGA